MSNRTILWQSEPEPGRFGRLKGRKVWHRVEGHYEGQLGFVAALCGVWEHKRCWDIGPLAAVPLEDEPRCKRCERRWRNGRRRCRAMSCPHLLTTAWRETACGISGAVMYAEDCEECAPSCLPWLGLQVALGKVRAEDMPTRAQDAIEVASRQAADPTRFPASREREEAAVALGLSPVNLVVERAQHESKARSRARRSKAMKRVWARRDVEQRAAQVAAMHNPAIYEARRKTP